MNILKKMKLALLATSVMLFPKAGHTMMKPEEEKSSAGQSRQLPSGPEKELASLMPTSSSSSLQATSTASTLQQTTIPGHDSIRWMEKDFGRSFLSSQEIRGALSSLSAKFNADQTKYDNALQNIRKNVFDQFVFPYTLDQRRTNAISESTLDAITPSLQNLALTSLNIVINEGSEGLKTRLEKLERMIVDLLEPTTLRSVLNEGRREINEKLNNIRSHKNPNYISLVSDLLKLQPSQIEFYYNILIEKNSLLSPVGVPRADLATKLTKEEDNITMVKFLINKPKEKIKDIVKSLNEMVPNELRTSLMHKNTVKALTSLDFDIFTARKKRFNQKVSIEKDKNLELAFLSLSLMIEDKDFIEFLRLTRENWKLFRVSIQEWPGSPIKHEINPALWGLSFEEMKERISAINDYGSLLSETAQESTESKIEREARFMGLSPAEIYETVRSQEAKNYFFETFLPKAAKKYEELTQLPASDAVLQVLFPSKTSPLTDFSPEVLRGKLGNFRDLFQLPPFPEFQPSESIGSSAAASRSGPELKEAAPSSSSSIHSAPTTFRTAGANPSARIKHSAVAIQLPNQDLLGDAYELVVNHRTRGEGPMVRIYDPKTKVYDNLGTLPASSNFRDTTFNITDWAKTARDTSSLGTQVATYLSFLNGKSDVHSFKIQSRGKVLKEIVFGDAASESQAGVHVYGPETDRDANEWSAKQSDDKEE